MPISLKLKEIFKKYFRIIFIYMVVSYNQNFSQIKKNFQKNLKNTKGKYFAFYTFSGSKLDLARFWVIALLYIRDLRSKYLVNRLTGHWFIASWNRVFCFLFGGRFFGYRSSNGKPLKSSTTFVFMAPTSDHSKLLKNGGLQRLRIVF